MTLKKLVFCNYYSALNKDNFMFENANTTIGDNLLAPMLELKRYAHDLQVQVGTVDVISLENASAVVFLDMPNSNNKYFQMARHLEKPLYLVTFESELIRPENFRRENHKYFNKVFTFHDMFIDSKKYFKINYSYVFPTSKSLDIHNKEKLCVLIASNKNSQHPFELYSKRVEAIRWFEQKHPEDFDLYGVSWDEKQFSGRFSRIFNRWPFVKKLCSDNFPSYCGKIATKKTILEKYKFAICYENARDIPGYITEKIFDCFFAGCVPIYWGANNITDHIPEECFIDKRKFDSYESLYWFITNISEKRFVAYLENIQKFLNSEKAYQFSCEFFSKTILKEIFSEI